MRVQLAEHDDQTQAGDDPRHDKEEECGPVLFPVGPEAAPDKEPSGSHHQLRAEPELEPARVSRSAQVGVESAFILPETWR